MKVRVWNEGQLKVAVMGEMVGAKVRLEVRGEERVGEVRVRGRGGVWCRWYLHQAELGRVVGGEAGGVEADLAGVVPWPK